MNRRARRAAGQRAGVGNVVACPDCNSEVTIVRLTTRVYRAEVRHDDSCPWFAAFQRGGDFGVRYGTGQP
ncbi:hypothetical protein [Mycolicibacterium septicum]|uniref:hypothetical protein n=1 Tax=Mycolicibacterium septicum TaxID=98668 RepID=UPI00235F519F|nr:hypothetical protein [Mycolicibacterium septicum]